MSSSDDNNSNGDNAETVATDHSGDRVDAPNPNDVLCGRGGNINSHKGNEQFRKLVEKRKRVYLTARFKREKRLIASSIVSEIRVMDPPGRFLARKGSMKDNSGFWYDIGDEKARDKTSQALRENAPSIRAEIETEINQQRAEMRRQEATVVVDPALASTKSVPNNTPSYSPQIHNHPATLGHLGHPAPPGPPPPSHPGHTHSYNPAHQSHYSQQYYDYYYHYYGYGAPPPPPPGYPSTGVAAPAGASHPAPQPGYPPPIVTQAPPAHPYWTSQTSPSATAAVTANGSGPTPPVPPAPPGSSSHPPGSTATNAVVTPSPPPQSGRTNAMDTADGKASSIPVAEGHASGAAHGRHFSHAHAANQEEEDRRLAMALQQEENVKAFEDRNRRFGSDRRSSRSTAYCAPGYRPRLLNDSIEATGTDAFGAPIKKRPPMSASHFFGPTSSSNRERASTPSSAKTENTFNNGDGIQTIAPPNSGSMEDGGYYEMDLKPPAAINPKRQQEDTTTSDNSHGLDHDHNHDFSCSSFSTRGRMEFKDDSEFSLFGEGGTVIPRSNVNSTGSFNRVRNTFAGTSPRNNKHNTNGNTQLDPIALEQSDRNHQQQQQQQQQPSGSRRDDNNNNHNRNHRHQEQQQPQPQNHQDTSLLSQVASHILGNFGVDASSWTDNNSSSNKQDHHHEGNNEPEMEMELGQEVIMDVRDESSSSMPPPHKRGNGTQVNWPSRSGCDTWIPDSMVDTASSANFGHDDNNRDENTNHQAPAVTHHHRHHHTNDHSLTGYSRADISPINSMDMDFSQSSLGLGQRANNNHNGRGTSAPSSLMNVFDQKTADPNTDEMLPQTHHRPVLQQAPSWERPYRSRSPIPLGDISGVDGMDSSLIRVHSRDSKDKLFGINGNNVAPQNIQPSVSLGQHNVHHQPLLPNHPHNNHLPPQGQQYQSPMKTSAMHGHHTHQNHPNQAPLSSRTPNYTESRDIDMDWD
mmetsp:Transcript_22126/g.44885  ORF Transcript_22126/g.44885 Transcript_22126/m.44885 type:complete len:974 (+) Transcript_22126:438-3359(+)